MGANFALRTLAHRRRESAMHGKVGRQRKALAERHPGGKIKHTRSEDRELRRSPAFQRRVIEHFREPGAKGREDSANFALRTSHPRRKGKRDAREGGEAPQGAGGTAPEREDQAEPI